MDARILVVEDDLTVAEVVVDYLRHAGLEPRHAVDGQAALEIAADVAAGPDHSRPDAAGHRRPRGLQRLREERAGALPVIMLTALGEERDRIAGLEVGADDYVTKPFSPRELVLRVQSVLRRPGPRSLRGRAAACVGDLEIDTVAAAGDRLTAGLPLTGREYDLLAFFLAHPGRAFSRSELLSEVWGWSFGDHSTVTVHVRRLREKLEDDPAAPKRITTVWGVGYRYEPQT